MFPGLQEPENRIFSSRWRQPHLSGAKASLSFLPRTPSVKDLRKTGFQARTFQGFQKRPERAQVLVIDEASMLSVPQMLWLGGNPWENRSQGRRLRGRARRTSVGHGGARRVLEKYLAVPRV